MYMVQAVKRIGRGEEVLVNYNYGIQGAPDWYQEVWFRYLR